MKNGILPFETCLDLEALMLCEISQRKTNTAGSHYHVKSKNKRNEHNQNRLTDIENKLVVTAED